MRALRSRTKLGFLIKPSANKLHIHSIVVNQQVAKIELSGLGLTGKIFRLFFGAKMLNKSIMNIIEVLGSIGERAVGNKPLE